ncbi:MAG: hypothetical protein DRN04_18695 [Thermoprotei archaeon]|nr:MAG: hypothetical protein DRN04_18695 [Thermoprotei archaeon]
MTKTIAIKDAAYKKLKEIKDRIKAESYSEVIMFLIENYEKFRLLKIKATINELKLSDDEIRKVKKIISELRERKWW